MEKWAIGPPSASRVSYLWGAHLRDTTSSDGLSCSSNNTRKFMDRTVVDEKPLIQLHPSKASLH